MPGKDLSSPDIEGVQETAKKFLVYSCREKAEALLGKECTDMVIFCKIAGLFCVLSASGYFAYGLSAALEQRCHELRKLYSILLQLKSEIQYMNDTLPECFRKLGTNMPEPFLTWVNFLADKTGQMQEEDFCGIWKRSLLVLETESSLCGEDITPLAELSDKLGSMDITSQLKAIDYVLLHLEKNRTTLEAELNQKKKVVVTLSLFCGFMTLILLL